MLFGGKLFLIEPGCTVVASSETTLEINPITNSSTDLVIHLDYSQSAGVIEAHRDYCPSLPYLPLLEKQRPYGASSDLACFGFQEPK